MVTNKNKFNSLLIKIKIMKSRNLLIKIKIVDRIVNFNRLLSSMIEDKLDHES